MVIQLSKTNRQCLFMLAIYRVLLSSSSFLDEIQEQMAGVEDEAVIVKDLFDLIHKYQVPTPPEDLAVYQVHHTLHYTSAHTVTTRGEVYGSNAPSHIKVFT